MDRPLERWPRLVAVAALLFAFAAHAEETPVAPPAAIPAPSDQFLYKGLVGNALELLPLDDDVRVQLQRANAVVSGPMSARSLAVLLGVANPLLMIPGFIWGIWSAAHIEERKADPARWLGTTSDGHRVGFCVRASVPGCELHVRDWHASEPQTEARAAEEPATPQLPQVAQAPSVEAAPLTP